MGTRGVDLGIAERDKLPAPARNAARRFRHFSDGPIEDLGPVAAIGGERHDKHRTDESALDIQSTDRFEVADDIRALAERSVVQARQAFDGFIGAAHRAVDVLSGQAETAGKGAKSLTEKAMTFAEKDIAISFEFATRFARARDMQEVLRLQADYLRAQMRLFSEPVTDQEK
jgi:hypothetical protein